MQVAVSEGNEAAKKYFWQNVVMCVGAFGWFVAWSTVVGGHAHPYSVSAYVICCGRTGFFFLLGGYQPGQSFLTSTRTEGYYTLTALYAVFTVAAGFADKGVARLGTKVSLFAGSFVYGLFILATGLSFFSESTAIHYALMLPTGALIGVGAALLWTAQVIWLVVSRDLLHSTSI
jgi:hypothetical protein